MVSMISVLLAIIGVVAVAFVNVQQAALMGEISTLKSRMAASDISQSSICASVSIMILIRDAGWNKAKLIFENCFVYLNLLACLQVIGITNADIGRTLDGGYDDSPSGESGYLEALGAVNTPTCS